MTTRDKNNDKPEQERSLPNAARLLHWLIEEDIPSELKERLHAWFKSDAGEEQKYNALREIFESLLPNTNPDRNDYQSLRQIQKVLGFPESKITPISFKPKKPLWQKISIRAAAVVIPFMVVTGAILFFKNNEIPDIPGQIAETVIITAPADKQKHVYLPDSSQVWLNGMSKISYASDFAKGRVIHLEGEAYFSVIKKTGVDFTVKTDNLTATVLGTQFNVRGWPGTGQTEVLLDEGSLEVQTATEKVLMKPMDKATVYGLDDRILLHHIPPDRSRWRTGVEFTDTPLIEALNEIASHFNLELIIDGNLPEDTIRFGFDYEASPELVMSVLKNTLNYFTYHIDHGAIKVTAN